MINLPALTRRPTRPRVCAYELNGRLGVSPTTTLMLAALAPPGHGYADQLVTVQLVVELLPTELWFLNKLRMDSTGREARVLRYDALKDTWKVITRHRW